MGLEARICAIPAPRHPRRRKPFALGVTPLVTRVPRNDGDVVIAVRLDGFRSAEQRVRFDSNTALNFSLDAVESPVKPAPVVKAKKKQKLGKESTLDPFAN